MTGSTAALHRPGTVGEAVRMLAEVGDAELLAGGTDLVPAMRAGTRRPRAIVALRRVVELRARGVGADVLTIGAGVTYAELADWAPAPGLAATARAVGSAQIRNAGTVGGALGSANPRGDLLTFLTAAGADVLTCSARRGPRATPLGSFLASTRAPGRGELVTAIRVPRPRGPQAFLKIGGRQAAYPTLVSCALVVDQTSGQVGCAVGGVAATPLRATEAESFATAEIDWTSPAGTSPGGTPPGGGDAARAAVARRFGALVADAARGAAAQLPEGPRDPAAYRWHAVGVLAERALARCLASGDDQRPGTPAEGGAKMPHLRSCGGDQGPGGSARGRSR
ncbi:MULTISPECIES: FAD binding domain-containing protein [Pseudofrankia]|uniref:FAD binding domain-containing protein n=1 Tax=Pseudofrankia TaxID=2994363 RepID=UPI000234BF8C|nr:MULTISPECIES: FAD binding domain-containing protein [Pseudofrankia]